MGNNPCGEMTTSYKIPLNAVNKDYNNFQMIEYNELFQYPSRYPYILSYLRKNNLLFEDMYFPISQGKQLIGPALSKQLYQVLMWKRVNELKKHKNVRFDEILFTRPSDEFRKPHPLYKLLAWITSMPRLVKKIFTFDTLNQQGLVIVNLPLWGSQDEPFEIVIDDQIPMKSEKDYSFNLMPNCNVATVLLEKTLAKVLGSYEKVRSQSVIDLFQSIVGLPVCAQQVGNKDPLQILARYYRPHYHLMSYNKKFQNHVPQYFKFTTERDIELSISLWQLLENPHSFEVTTPGQIVMELMRVESQSKVIRVAYSSKLFKDKTYLRTLNPTQDKTLFAGHDFLKLQRGNYLLHIYTKTDNVSVNGNLIVYSSAPLNLTYRKENYELSSYKRRMAESIFLQNYKELEKCIHADRVFNRFIWDGFRGILAFKNEEKVRIKVTILILEEYRRKIKFEHTEQYEQIIFIKPGSKKIISFVKFLTADVGNFYTVNISFLKQDIQQNGMSTPYTTTTISAPNSGTTNIRPQSNVSSPGRAIQISSPFKAEQYDYDQPSFIQEGKQFNRPY